MCCIKRLVIHKDALATLPNLNFTGRGRDCAVSDEHVCLRVCLCGLSWTQRTNKQTGYACVCLCVNVWVRSPTLLNLSVPVHTGKEVCVRTFVGQSVCLCVCVCALCFFPYPARPRAVCTCRSWWCPAASTAPAGGRP